MALTVDYSNGRFAAFYQAVCHYLDGDVGKARTMFHELAERTGDRLASFMAQDLDGDNVCATVDEIFSNPDVYEAVTSLPHFTEMRGKYASIVAQFIDRQYAKLKDVYVLDVGVGDGKQLAEIFGKIKSSLDIHVTILDPSKRFMNVARERIVGSRLQGSVEVREVVAKIEDVLPQDLLSSYNRRYDILLGSNSLHHIPFHGKGSLISTCSALASYMFIHEIDADHDRPERGAIELVYSVWSLYNKTLDITMESTLPDDIKILALRYFFGPEARNILFKSRAERGEYHLPASLWCEIVLSSCPKSALVLSGSSYVNRPITMMYQCFNLGSMSALKI